MQSLFLFQWDKPGRGGQNLIADLCSPKGNCESLGGQFLCINMALAAFLESAQLHLLFGLTFSMRNLWVIFFKLRWYQELVQLSLVSHRAQKSYLGLQITEPWSQLR